MSENKYKKIKIEGKVSFEIEYIGELNNKLKLELELLRDDLIYIIADSHIECCREGHESDLSITKKVKVKLKKVK